MPKEAFASQVGKSDVIPVVRRIMADHLSPVLAYRRLVAADDRTAPSFLFESVENGDEVGRFSFLGSDPSVEIIAYEHDVIIRDIEHGTEEKITSKNPLDLLKEKSKNWNVAPPIAMGDLPLPSFTGGWVGYAGYDTARFKELDSLPFDTAPSDDRNLPDIHMALYRTVVVFDHVAKIAHVIHNSMPNSDDADTAWDAANEELDRVVAMLQNEGENIPVGTVEMDLATPPSKPTNSTMTQEAFESAVVQCKEYIGEGDAFQIVISQRFEHRSIVDPFEVYRTLRVVNPSPYMIYLQAEGCILAASSPDILCRCRDGEVVKNEELAQEVLSHAGQVPSNI